LGGNDRTNGRDVNDVADGAETRVAAQKKSLIASERDEVARAIWRQEHADLLKRPVLFLDETSTQTVMTRSHARAPRGVRAVARVPRNHGENVTCLMGISPAGIVEPLVFAGALDGPIFAQWMRERLLPQLAPGTTIVLDNLSVHKNASARSAVERAGCRLLFLPAYSPDFNPIELANAKLKTYLRMVGARAFDPLVDAIGQGLNRITPQDARAFFRHCGYDVPEP
jgi:hypothetical protein